jgi:hypothetical protein
MIKIIHHFKGKWSDRMQEMCELEDLTLFAETEVGYRQKDTIIMKLCI